MLAVRELDPGETWRAAAALLVLRPHLRDAEALVARVDGVLRADGLRVAGSFEDGAEQAAAAAGFRVGESLAWGRFLYVDDLSTLPDRRGRGHAGALLDWLADRARQEGCGELHLDSGVGPERADAHRLYLRRGMRIASHHFTLALS